MNNMKNIVSCNAASRVTMLNMGSLELLLRASVFTVLAVKHSLHQLRDRGLLGPGA